MKLKLFPTFSAGVASSVKHPQIFHSIHKFVEFCCVEGHIDLQKLANFRVNPLLALLRAPVLQFWNWTCKGISYNE